MVGTCGVRPWAKAHPDSTTRIIINLTEQLKYMRSVREVAQADCGHEGSSAWNGQTGLTRRGNHGAVATSQSSWLYLRCDHGGCCSPSIDREAVENGRALNATVGAGCHGRPALQSPGIHAYRAEYEDAAECEARTNGVLAVVHRRIVSRALCCCVRQAHRGEEASVKCCFVTTSHNMRMRLRSRRRL